MRPLGVAKRWEGDNYQTRRNVAGRTDWTENDRAFKDLCLKGGTRF